MLDIGQCRGIFSPNQGVITADQVLSYIHRHQQQLQLQEVERKTGLFIVYVTMLPACRARDLRLVLLPSPKLITGTSIISNGGETTVYARTRTFIYHKSLFARHKERRRSYKWSLYSLLIFSHGYAKGSKNTNAKRGLLNGSGSPPISSGH